MKEVKLNNLREVELAEALKQAKKVYKKIHLTGESPLLANIFYTVLFWGPAITLASLDHIYPIIYEASLFVSAKEYIIKFTAWVFAFSIIGFISYFLSKLINADSLVVKETKANLVSYNDNLIIIHSCYNSIVRDGYSGVLDYFEKDIKYISGTAESVSNIVEKVCPSKLESIVDISFNHSNYGNLITLEYYSKQ